MEGSARLVLLDLGFKAGFWALMLGFVPRGGDLGLKLEWVKGGRGKKKKKEKEKKKKKKEKKKTKKAWFNDLVSGARRRINDGWIDKKSWDLFSG